MNDPAASRTQQLEALRRSPELHRFVERAETGGFSMAQVSRMHREAQQVLGDIDEQDFTRLVTQLRHERRVQPAQMHAGDPYELGSIYAPQTQATATLADPRYIAGQYRFDPSRGDFFLGRCPFSGTPLGTPLQGHAIMFAMTRSGKGTGIIIPNHLTWRGSLLSIDPKGENATVTASRRGQGSNTARGMGQKVVVLDPFKCSTVDDQYRGRFNPLDELDPADPACEAKARSIAEAMVVKTGHETEEYWKDEPIAILETVILHVITAKQFEGKRDLLTVRELVSGGDELAAAAYAKRHPDKEPRDPTAMLFGMIKANRAFGGKLRKKAVKLLRLFLNGERQWVGVDSGLDVQTRWLDDRLIRECVRGPSSFKLSEFKDLPQGLSVYICLPTNRTEHYFRWQRVILNLAAEEHTSTTGNGIKGLPTLFSLDEFAVLEKLKTFQVGISNFAGHGIRLLTVLQDIPQLKDKYKEAWPTFIGNSTLKIFFGMENVETAEYAQKLVGDVELVRDAMSQGVNVGSNRGVNLSHGQGTSAGLGVTSSDARGQSISQGVSHADTYSQATAAGQSRNTARGSTSGTSSSFGQTNNFSRTQGVGTNASVGSSRTNGVSQSQNDGMSFDDPGWLFRGAAGGPGLFSAFWQENGRMNVGSSSSSSASVGSNASRGHSTQNSHTSGSGYTSTTGVNNSNSVTDSHGESLTNTVSQGGSDTRSSTNTDTQTTTHGTSTNLSAQRSQNAGVQAGTSHQRSGGMQEVFQTRPFFQLNELREYFARLDDKRHPAYPGLALMFLNGEAPAVVRRVNYYED